MSCGSVYCHEIFHALGMLSEQPLEVGAPGMVQFHGNEFSSIAEDSKIQIRNRTANIEFDNNLNRPMHRIHQETPG
jgi:hypothetical protein